MATYANAINATYLAGSAITQHKFVSLAADGQVDHSANGAAGPGVSVTDQATVGGAVTVQEFGRALVESGGTITVGDDVASDTAGVAITAAIADIVRGVALESGVSGQIIAVKLIDGGNAAA
jgi:hypothetical protein